MNLIGLPIDRIEDARLLRGLGRFTDDHARPDAAHLHVLRSPHAHAVITRIDTRTAFTGPGVLLVCTGADYIAAGLGHPAMNQPALGPTSRMRTDYVVPPNTVLPADRVRYVGEPVAFVVARTAAQARDAAEGIVVDYAALPAVTDLATATDADTPRIWDAAPNNLCCEIEIGDPAATAAAFAQAARIVSASVVNNRVYGCPMEPRSAIADHDPATGRLTLIAGHQLPNPTRDSLADVLHIPPADLRVISPDLGGGFGVRGQCFPEYIFLLWAARTLGTGIKWCGDRSESFLSDSHGRDSLWHGQLALDAEGHILALRVHTLANLGAYHGHAGPLVPVSAGPRVLTGNYRVPALDALIRVAFTNTVTVAPYRGAGQPEAIYLIERLMDQAAVETGIDRIALRARNLLPPEAFPVRTVTGALYDSGDYDAGMRQALHNADWAGFPQRRARAAARGRLAGIGLANYVQVAGGAPAEWGSLTIEPAGRAVFRVGTHNHGQGHQTTYAQIVASELGIDIAQVRIVEGDTDQVLAGSGTHGSRSLFKAGEIMLDCCTAIVLRARRIAALHLDVPLDAVTCIDNELRTPSSNLVFSLFDIAELAATADNLPDDLAAGLVAQHHLMKFDVNFPSGTHICELEIDPETGALTLLRFTAIDDAGRLINPTISRGQMHGGIVQGIGQAVCERIAYDPADGQLLTASLQDYALPRAADLPAIDVAFQEIASPTNRLGIKGIGESGPTGAPPAVVSAILDALAPLGIRHIDMPATPERIWRAIHHRQERTPA